MLQEEVATARDELEEMNTRVARADQTEADLGRTRRRLEEKEAELGEVKVKLNDNYVLVAQLSSENLRTLGEKVGRGLVVFRVF